MYRSNEVDLPISNGWLPAALQVSSALSPTLTSRREGTMVAVAGSGRDRERERDSQTDKERER